jgi:hypothetical protein
VKQDLTWLKVLNSFPPPRTYDFDNETDASNALDAVIGELYSAGGIAAVSGVLNNSDQFRIGFTDDGLVNINSVVSNGNNFSWNNSGTGIRWVASENARMELSRL